MQETFKLIKDYPWVFLVIILLFTPALITTIFKWIIPPLILAILIIKFAPPWLLELLTNFDKIAKDVVDHQRDNK